MSDFIRSAVQRTSFGIGREAGRNEHSVPLANCRQENTGLAEAASCCPAPPCWLTLPLLLYKDVNPIAKSVAGANKDSSCHAWCACCAILPYSVPLGAAASRATCAAAMTSGLRAVNVFVMLVGVF